ncbi:MAG: hypothetical protein LBM93_15035 [Oscillospiraceae bacterium]|jgi:hypothetical protein|nr:hypothetical protein [Oscillospiraceae bacterium]
MTNINQEVVNSENEGFQIFSACIARLISTYSGLKLQAIINTQIDAINCLEWGNKIYKEDYFIDIKSVYLILTRLIKKPDFMIGHFYYNSIKSLIIDFTSTLEYFLKDNMRLNMKRNYALLKKGLYDSKISIKPIDIVEFDDIELIRLKYIIEISNIICTGELWSNKFKKYVKFLSLPNNLFDQDINKKIDAIWKIRNDIAHANADKLSLNLGETTYVYNSYTNVAQYTDFALLFIKLVDDTITFLTEVDKLSLKNGKLQMQSY